MNEYYVEFYFRDLSDGISRNDEIIEAETTREAKQKLNKIYSGLEKVVEIVKIKDVQLVEEMGRNKDILDIKIRHGKMNPEFYDYSNKDEGDRDRQCPQFRLSPEEIDSVINEIMVNFDDFLHIGDAVHYMLVISKQMRENKDDNGVPVKAEWNGHILEVQWSWNRKIDYKYVDSVVRKGLGVDEPCGIFKYPDDKCEEEENG